ncbi:MAG: aminotransferase class V-fold PLP-dependent enzyme [Planctomycetes bacterium]|nr:aminotransferase class V-fold PLP-dependent enzyme [Planctomycetota bacterium]
MFYRYSTTRLGVVTAHLIATMPLMTAQTRIYLDNAATSFPKPPAVLEAINHFATQLGASPGRGSYAESLQAGRLLDQTRSRLCRLINGADPRHVIFSLNCSDALNMAIRGVVWADASRPRHLITTDLDHNSILRPFNALCRHEHITQTRVPVDPATGLVDPDDVRRAITADTCLIALLHASNVTGTVQPIGDIGAIAREHGVLFCVDAAQSLGHLPVDVESMHIDLLAAPGHKGLLGPLGTGFLYIRPGVEHEMTTTREGGTGSVSESDIQPDFLPDRFEPGSHNTPGILGLGEGVQWLIDRGIDHVAAHESALIETFLGILRDADLPALHLYGPPTAAHRCGVFSVRVDGYDNPVDLSAALENEYGVLTRSGLHCAPGAHQTLGTASCGGTTRLSFGPMTSIDDVTAAARALVELAHAASPAVASSSHRG